MDNKVIKMFSDWEKRISGNYIKAICKPCWELKYCPYGPLVEQFPLECNDEVLCTIFGHQCPVFTMGEPLTETKEIRNLSRNISMEVKLKVSRRDRYQCALCKKNVSDDEINYDHIIPWSKGGASSESNIRILCETCNKARGNNYEEEFLLASHHEVFYNPLPLGINEIADLLLLMQISHKLTSNVMDFSPEMFCKIIETDDPDTDKFMCGLINSLYNTFINDPFFIKIRKKENILKYRWGFMDGHIHSVSEVCSKFKVSLDYYLQQEDILVRQIGFYLEKKKLKSEDFTEISVDADRITSLVDERLAIINKQVLSISVD